MFDLFHSVTVNTPPSAVYAALTGEAGLKGWWTDDVSIEPREGGIAEFGFHGRATVFRMKIVKLEKNSLVQWICVDGPEEWIGTTQVFRLADDGEGGTQIDFCHGGWRAADGHLPMCNTTWGYLMHGLKDYAETGKPCPYFTSP